MKSYFNVSIEFNKSIVNNTIEDAITANKKGYVCVLESNNITIANKNESFRRIVNQSLINICDGSNVAWLLAHIHKKRFTSYTGNDIFIHFFTQKKHKQYFIGNTSSILSSLKENLSHQDPNILQMEFQELPFNKVEEFNYKQIADSINSNAPDIIWVSLGAPKQEIFMSMLNPYLKKGVMFGVGAVFNFNANTGNVKRAPAWMRKLRMEWIYRAFEEPKKNIPRYWNFIQILPKLTLSEWRSDQKK